MSSFEASNLFNVKGLVAVVTGGGSGIGLMMAKALALNGAEKVYIVGRRQQVLEDAAKESPHGNIIPIVGDITSKDSLKAVAQRIADETGYMNLLIANSGVLGPQSRNVKQLTSIAEVQEAMWSVPYDEYVNVLEVNVTATYFSIIAFLDLLDRGNKKGNLEQKSQIVAISSIAGFNRQVPGGFAYGQSKAAVTQMVKQFSTIFGVHDIRVNALAPGRKFSLSLFSYSICKPPLGKTKYASR